MNAVIGVGEQDFDLNCKRNFFLKLFLKNTGENSEKDAKIKEFDGKIKALVEKDAHNAEELKDLRVKAAKVS